MADRIALKRLIRPLETCKNGGGYDMIPLYHLSPGEFMRPTNIYFDEIYEFENFISQREAERLVQFAQSKSDKDWNILESGTPWQGKIVLYDEDDLISNIRDRIVSLFDPSWRINAMRTIQRLNKDLPTLVLHHDSGGGQFIKYGAVIYLNDEYTGGEIYYPKYDFTIKPKKYSMLIHPGYLEHGVNSVTNDNTRYMLTTFIRHKEIDKWSF